MTAYLFWRHICRINSFNNILVNPQQFYFFFLPCAFPVLFRSWTIHHLLWEIYSTFQGKVTFQLELVSTRVWHFITRKGKVAKIIIFFSFFFSALLSHLSHSHFFFVHSNTGAHPGTEYLPGSNSLPPKPYAATQRQSTVTNSLEAGTFSFILFVAFDTIGAE